MPISVVPSIIIYSLPISFEELRKCLNSKDVIGSTARFPATMHGKDGIAHIYTSQGNRRSQNISQCAASSNITLNMQF